MKTILLFSTVFLFAFHTICRATQVDDATTLHQLMQQDSTDINTLAAYPEDVRKNVFEVSAYPDGITKLNDVQKQSNEQFKNLLSSYPKEEQQKIWNITRYDGLISKLVQGEKKSSEEIETILKDYPKDVHDDALSYATNHRDLLISIDKMNKQFSQSFDNIIQPYPEKTQTAFRELIKTPEVITILNNNMNMTVRLGGVYKNNPSLVVQKFDELNLQLAQQKAKDSEDWKQTVQNDPEAKKELKESAAEYAKENGYNENDLQNTSPTIVEHYVYVPYPYWCGYPWWYSDPYWYPYPFWYHSGFYYWHDDFVWIGPPSWYFIHWHFHNHPHFYNYPHLTNAYLHYYHGPRRAVITNSREVNTWVRENRKTLPKGFLKNDAQRSDRIKEYGKFQVDYDKQTRSNPSQPVKREDFLQQHAEEYPHMKPRVADQKNSNGNAPIQSVPGNKNETTRPRNEQPARVPETRPREQQQPPVRNAEPRPREQHVQPPVRNPEPRQREQQARPEPRQKMPESRPPREQQKQEQKPRR